MSNSQIKVEHLLKDGEVIYSIYEKLEICEQDTEEGSKLETRRL